jgi:hypothetical protein
MEIFKELEFKTLANDILKHPLAGNTATPTANPCPQNGGRQKAQVARKTRGRNARQSVWRRPRNSPASRKQVRFPPAAIV